MAKPTLSSMTCRSSRAARSITGTFVVTTLLAACAPGDGGLGMDVVRRDSAGITIVENRTPTIATRRLGPTPLLTVGEGGPVEQTPLDPMAGFFADDGRIIVGDGNQVGWDAVLVYDAAGQFLMKLGGSGRGPGEFGGQLWWAGPYRGDSIVAWDRRGPTGPSIKVYGADGGFSRDVTIPRIPRDSPEGTFGFSIGFHGAFSDGSFLTSADGAVEVPPEPGPAWYTHPLLAVTPEGETWDTIGDFRFSQTYWDGRGQEQYLYGTQVYEVPYGDELIRGDPQTYEYQILDRTGIPRLIVRKTSEPRAVSQQDVEAVVTFYIEAAARRRSTTPQEMNQLRRTVEGYPRATNKPAYSNILIDPERNVWVERFRWFVPWSLPQDPTPTVWDVFASSGEWIGEVEVPTGVLLLAVSRNRALGVRIDEVDVRHVLVFELQPSPTKR